MALIDNPTRITVSDFPPEQQQTVERLAEIYNHFAENVTNVVNGNLTYENYNKKSIVIQVIVNAEGTPSQVTRFSSIVGLKGITVINAKNITSATTYPLAQPFISFGASGSGVYTIVNVRGLQANNKYELTLELCF